MLNGLKGNGLKEHTKLEKIILFRSEFDQELERGFLPASVREIDLGEKFDRDLAEGVFAQGAGEDSIIKYFSLIKL